MKIAKVLFITFVMSLACVLGAVAGGSSEAGAEGQEELTIMLHPVLYSATGGDGGLIQKFSEETGIDVEVVTGPLDQILEKTLLDFVAGTSAVDVFVYNDTALHSGLSDHLLPLDDYISAAGSEYDFADILTSTVDLGKFDGEIYGIPFRYGVYMLYYRQDLFDKYNVKVPETWDEFNYAAKTITEGLRKDGINDVYGLVHPGEAGHIIYEVFKTWLAGHGGIIADESGAVKINSPEAVQALTTMIEPYKNGWVSPDTPAMPLDKTIAEFQNGKAAMTLTYSPYWGLFTNEDSSQVYDKVSWALTPHAPGVKHGRSSFSGWQLLINKNTEYPEAAWKLVEYLTTTENSLEEALYYSNGPVRKSVLTNPEYLEKYEAAKGWLEGFDASEPILPGGHEKISEIIDIIGREVSNAFIGKKSPEEALNDAQEKIEVFFK